MSESIIVAVLALLGSVFGSIISGSKTTAVIETRLDALEQKYEKLNNLIERMYRCESEVAALKDHMNK